MSHYVKLADAEKLKLLQEHSFQAPFPTLDQKHWCLHCEQEFETSILIQPVYRTSTVCGMKPISSWPSR